MAALRTPDGKIAQFVVNDGQGNECIGHLELTIVATFEPGGRNGDLTFVVDDKIASAASPQSPAELLVQAPRQNLMS